MLIITPHYPPDGGPSAALFAMLSEELVQRGWSVTVLAATPHYPSGYPPPSWVPSENETVEFQQGVQVVRVVLPAADRTRLPARLGQFLLYQIGAALKTRSIRVDAVVASGPGLQTLLPFRLAARRATTCVYSVHDVYPDVGISLGIFRNRLVIWLVTWIERACLSRADYVRYLAPAFKRPLLRLGVPAERLRLIPDWVDTTFVVPMERRTRFIEELGLQGRFVILYAGNLGLSQGLESVLEAAYLLRERHQIAFLFVGDGAGRESLRARALALGLANVHFAPYQPRHRLPEVLASCDAGLVSMRKGFADSLPSKVYSHLASGRPVLAAVAPNGDVAALIRESNAGILVEPEEAEAIAKAIVDISEMSAETRTAMGQRGRAFAESRHSPMAAADAFEALLARKAPDKDDSSSEMPGPLAGTRF